MNCAQKCVNYAQKFDELCAKVWRIMRRSLTNYAQKFINYAEKYVNYALKFKFWRTVYFKKWENQGFFEVGK